MLWDEPVSLRDKTVLIIGMVSLIMLALVAFVGRPLFLANHRQMEMDRALHVAFQVRALLDLELRNLQGSAADWGAWDATYEFVEVRNADYIQTHLVPDVYPRLHLHLIAILAPDSELVYGGGYDLAAGGVVQLPGDFLAPLKALEPVRTSGGHRSSWCGLVKFGSELFLCAAQPILRSDGSGPGRGTLIMGRRLASAVQEGLEDALGYKITCHAGPGGLSDQAGTMLPGRGDDADDQVQILGDYVAVAVLLRDISGQVAGRLNVRVPATTMAVGVAVLDRFIFTLLVGAVLLMALVYMLLNRFVLVPISKLTEEIVNVREKNDMSGRLSVGRSECHETRRMAEEINRMLVEIEVNCNALNSSCDRLQYILDNTTDAIFQLNLDGRFVFANPASCRLAECSEAELLGQHFTQLIFPEDAETVKRLFCLASQGKPEKEAIECAFLNRSEEKVYVEVMANPVWHDGRISAVQGVARDVTSRRQVEAELRLAREFSERANLAKSEFLAVMSHELRTPLTAVLGLAETLYEQLPGPLNEQQKKCVMVIRESGESLLALLNDILDLSKIEAGRVEPQFATINIAAVCRASLNFIKLPALKKSIAVVLNADGAPGNMQADVRFLKQILVNLLGNAVKFTKPGGRAGLDVRQNSDSGMVEFTVWDTGIGIKKVDMEGLFRPFSQVETGPARRHSGTGLGLALVERLVRLHGGGIHAESEFGRGTRFIFALPNRTARETAENGESGAPSRGGFEEGGRAGAVAVLELGAQLKILLVEDDDETRHILGDYLAQKGLSILPAGDAQEALGICEAVPPDAIVTDLDLFGVEGLDVLHLFRMNPALKNVPIMVLSGRGFDDDREKCLAAGAADYMMKPCRLNELFKRIRQMVQ